MGIIDRLGSALSDRYRLDRMLGEGGMALVYLAHDLKHGRPVAIKVLRPEVSTTVGAERFLREIEVVAGLNHPNILPLHDSGDADGLLYFVMPFVEGESLRDRLNREGSIAVDDALRIASEVGDALQYAHDRGLVHRDIKPENILFQAEHALVCDFGIAQATHQAGQTLTRAGTSVGTLAYMAPEQYTDAGAAVDGRCDVYALGCTLYEMLTGTQAFLGKTPRAVLARKLTEAAPELPPARKDIPSTLQRVLERSLSVDPEDRFSTAQAFIEALRSATTRVAMEAETRRRWRRRILRRVGATAAIVLLVLAGWRLGDMLRAPAMQRIAVMPLVNADPASTADYFVEGAYNDLVLEMSKAIRVISTGSAERVAAEGLRPRDVAAALNVDGVITGRASQGPGQVAITLQLADARSEEIVWSERFEADPREILNLYRRATRLVAETMGVELSRDEMERLGDSQEVDPRVYEALLQARFHWQKLTAEGIDNAEDYFQQALALSDSTSAAAWTGLSRMWGIRAQMGLVAGDVARERGAEALARAQKIDPGIHTEEAAVQAWLAWDWEASAEAYRAAAESDPSNSATRAYLAHILLYLGHGDEARTEMERAVAEDPYNPLVLGLYGQFLNFVRRYDEAEEAFQRALERAPDNPLALSNFRATYHNQGRFDEAMPIWRQYYATRGDSAAVSALDAGYARGGYTSALRAVAETFAERDDPALRWQIATLYTRAGDRGPALHYLEEALRVHDPNLPYITIDPIFDFLRDEPRFTVLVDSLHLPG